MNSPIPTPTTDYRTLNPANQHYYRYYMHSYPWNDAKTFCEARGGYLVTIQDAEENEFVYQISYGNTWLGATDQDEEGVWVWNNDESFNYVNWAPGEPNDIGNKDFLAFMDDNSENFPPSSWIAWQFYATSRNFTCEWNP